MNYQSSQSPDRNTKDVTYMVHELLLHSCNGIMVLQYKFSEKWCRAVLDSDASSTVHGNIVCNIGVSTPFPHSCQAPPSLNLQTVQAPWQSPSLYCFFVNAPPLKV